MSCLIGAHLQLVQKTALSDQVAHCPGNRSYAGDWATFPAPSSALIAVRQGNKALRTLAGNPLTARRQFISPRSGRSGRLVSSSSWQNRLNSILSSPDDRPGSHSINMEALAFVMAQASPEKAASWIVPSATRNSTRMSSPHRASCPRALWVASCRRPWYRGERLWSSMTCW